MKPLLVPLSLLEYLYGASNEYFRLRANDGRLGEIVTEPGRRRNRCCYLAEAERLLGERTLEQFEDAVRRYERDRCITRRVAS